MEYEEHHNDALTPTALEYATPDRSPAADRAAVRFTAGASLPILTVFALDVRAGFDMSTCYATGVFVQLAIVGGAFSIGRRCLEQWGASRLVERNKWATFAGGAMLSGLFLGAPILWDIGGLPSSRGLAAASLFLAFVAPAICPWWVYRPTGESRGGSETHPD